VGPAPHEKNSGGARSTITAGRNAQLCWRRNCVQRTPGAIADDPVLAKHMTAKRAYVLAAEEDQNDTCEDELSALFEFLTAEPAVCPTA
jgi:hypothetical protein